MSDFFTIELDTTAPGIEIFMPAYSGRENWNEIVVQSDENLDERQEFYFIDSFGDARAVTFSFEENRFLGGMRFNDFPNGIATLVAFVWDEVGNPSPVIEKSINVVGDSMAGTVDIVLQRRSIELAMAERSKELFSYNRITQINSDTRDQTLQTRIRRGGIAIE